MPRLRNVHTGVIVNVPDEKAARFDSQWELADKPEPKAPEKHAAPRKAEPKSSK